MDWKPNVTVLAVLAFGLVACAAPETQPDEHGKTPLLGGGTGDARIAGAVAGTVIGGFIGRELGEPLDSEDVALAQAAQERAYAAPSGQQVTWTNPATGHSGTITFVKDGRDVSGHVCRDYQATVDIRGQTRKAYGTACREVDGHGVDGIWKVVNN